MVFTTSLDANCGFEDFEIFSNMPVHDLGYYLGPVPHTAMHNAPNTQYVP